ncbi:hypothetical protein GE09DRAFT_187189 [Coniochaeta sp. 2T2.1]|nr:hypothetical protein GE09DRAFT_187189 [Coniochaeta sp. 2T2.1]
MAPGSAAARSRASLAAAQAMPIIAEDDSVPPAVPKRSASRRAGKPLTTPATVFNYNYMPNSRTPSSTIPSSSSDGTMPDRKPEVNNHHLEALRKQEWVARRGGWYKIMIITFLVVAAIIGLAVGLTLGLRKENSSSSTTDPTPLSTLFPAGNYTLSTALSSLTTSCSSSPQTWRCYPYTLYSPSLAPSSNASTATFFWTITPKTSWSYTISSTPNPFAPSFADIPLTLHDPNQYTEHFTFNFSLRHSSVVEGQLAPSSTTATTTCWFNSTVMAVTLWTRMRADFPAGIEGVNVPVGGTGSDGGFATWPFRVEVRQTQLGGEGVPDCRDPAGGKVGGGDLGGDGECGCFYRNYELGDGRSGNATTGATNSVVSTTGTAAGTRSTSVTSAKTSGTSSASSGRVTGRASSGVSRIAPVGG